MRVIVTRPAAQAADWVAQLREQGIDAVALPLIGIAPADSGSALEAAWRTLAQQRLVVFVSPNAAVQFFARRPNGALWPAGVLAGSPGPGTTRTLVDLGLATTQIVEPAADAAQFDSETLWAQLADRDWQGARVLIVRGSGGRNWLGDTLREQGAKVTALSAYRRVAPEFDADQAQLLRVALEQPARHLWFFSSSEAIDNLAASAPVTGAGVDWGRARAIATHPRIAARAQRLGFASVSSARPSLGAIVACIQSLRP
ncbi:MAG: uroporphyrinogen-III synthase [Burkholderiaceae bacterium]